MRYRLAMAIQVVALIGTGVFPSFAAAAQNAEPPSLKEKLHAQYEVASVSGNTVVKPGTVLSIQKAGILGSSGNVAFEAIYRGGVLHAPSRFGVSLIQRMQEGTGGPAIDTRPLRVGEKVYVYKIDLNLKKDRVVFSVIECDACNGVTQPSPYIANVLFQFAKGYLGTASAPGVEDTIGQVLAIDTPQTEAPPPPASEQPAPAQVQATPGQTLTNDDIMKLMQVKLADAVIIAKIKSSDCAFDTSADALIKLKQAGVSDTVLQSMIAAGGGGPATEPAPQPAPPPEVSFAEEGRSSRWSGMIVRSDKDASTLTVRKRGTNVEKTVHYNSSTKWTHQEGTEVTTIDMSEVKDGDRVIALGKYDEKGEFHATRIDLR